MIPTTIVGLQCGDLEVIELVGGAAAKPIPDHIYAPSVRHIVHLYALLREAGMGDE